MSGGFPVPREICNGVSIGVSAGAAHYGTSVPSGAANTIGAWTTIVASTSADTSWACMQVETNGTFNNWGLNIGVGASGSERAICTNLYLGNDAGSGGSSGVDSVCFELPIAIPAGSRVAAQLQSSGASDTAYVTMQLFDGAMSTEGFAGIEAIGFDVPTTSGTTVTPGTNTKGSYAQLTAATTRDYQGFSIGAGTNAIGGLTYGFDIAIGPGGSERVILPDIVLYAWSYTMVPPPTIFWIPIPAGTRIAARAEVSVGTTPQTITLNGIFQ